MKSSFGKKSFEKKFTKPQRYRYSSCCKKRKLTEKNNNPTFFSFFFHIDSVNKALISGNCEEETSVERMKSETCRKAISVKCRSSTNETIIVRR